MTYDLRRLRLHGLIERIPHTHRYRTTALGLRIALFLTRLHRRLFLPNLAALAPGIPPPDSPLRASFDACDRAIARALPAATLAM